MLRLSDIMTTEVLTVTPDTTLREAAELLAERHLGGAPVLAGRRVVGVVSASDILAFAASAPAEPEEREEPGEGDGPGVLPGWETEDEPPARYFSELWTDAGSAGGERAPARHPAAGGVLDAHTVAEAMTRHVYALPPTADVSAAADRMRTTGVHRVLVMDGEALLGIVSTMDLAHAVADHRIVRRTYVFDSSGVERDHDRGDF